jgi:hypothetical protein
MREIVRRILDAKAEVEEDDAAEGAIVPYRKLTKINPNPCPGMTCRFTAQATVLDDMNVETVRFRPVLSRCKRPLGKGGIYIQRQRRSRVCHCRCDPRGYPVR